MMEDHGTMILHAWPREGAIFSPKPLLWNPLGAFQAFRDSLPRKFLWKS